MYKNIKVTKQIASDMRKFCVPEDYSLIELKSKYLSLSKIYHPDIRKDDSSATKLFQELNESYERLKVFYELRKNSNTIQENIKKYGRVVISEVVENFHEIYKSDKSEIVKILCKSLYVYYIFISVLENEYGMIKEPKHFVNIMFILWGLIGICVFYKDISKYKRNLSKRRPNVIYDF